MVADMPLSDSNCRIELGTSDELNALNKIQSITQLTTRAHGLGRVGLGYNRATGRVLYPTVGEY